MYVFVLWTVAIFCMFFANYGIVFCYNVETLNNNYMDVITSGCATTKLGAAFWNALYRPMWAIGVGMMIYLCDMGYGLIINDFFSADIFMILD